jgi:signal transduction histidine kinase
MEIIKKPRQGGKMTNFIDRLILALISLLIHGLVWYDYWFGQSFRFFPSYWSQQYTVAVLLLALLAVGLPFYRNVALLRGIILVRAGITLALTAPFIAHPGRFGLLYAVLIFESFFYFTWRQASLLGLAYILSAAILVHARPTLWSFTASRVIVNPPVFIPTGIWCLLGGVMGALLSREHRLRLKNQAQLETLRNANLALAEANMDLQDMAAQAELTTMFKERTRIAREIHDSLAYTLTNLTALLNAYSSRFRTKGFEIPDEIHEAILLAKDGLKDVRQVLRTLRPKENELYNGLGNIHRLVKVFQQATGVKVTVSYGNTPQFFDQKLEKIIYRLVQEGLTNSFRHGNATEVLISLHLLPGQGVELIVKDNGCGAATTTGGFGLAGVNERVAEINGKVSIYSKPDCGFTLQVWLPFSQGSDLDGTLENNHC